MYLSTLESIMFGDACEDEVSLIKAYHERYQQMNFLNKGKIDFQVWSNSPNKHISWCFISPRWRSITSEPVTLVLFGSSSPMNSTLFYDDRVISPCFITFVQRYLMKKGVKQENFMTWTNWKDEHIQTIHLPVHYSIIEEAIIFTIHNFIDEGRRLNEYMDPLDVN